MFTSARAGDMSSSETKSTATRSTRALTGLRGAILKWNVGKEFDEDEVRQAHFIYDSGHKLQRQKFHLQLRDSEGWDCTQCMC